MEQEKITSKYQSQIKNLKQEVEGLKFVLEENQRLRKELEIVTNLLTNVNKILDKKLSKE